MPGRAERGYSGMDVGAVGVWMWALCREARGVGMDVGVDVGTVPRWSVGMQ